MGETCGCHDPDLVRPFPWCRTLAGVAHGACGNCVWRHRGAQRSYSEYVAPVEPASSSGRVSGPRRTTRSRNAGVADPAAYLPVRVNRAPRPAPVAPAPAVPAAAPLVAPVDEDPPVAPTASDDGVGDIIDAPSPSPDPITEGPSEPSRGNSAAPSRLPPSAVNWPASSPWVSPAHRAAALNEQRRRAGGR